MNVKVTMTKVAMFAFGTASILPCFAGTVHQEYDGPWHWSEITSYKQSLNGVTYRLKNGNAYPVVIGNKYTGTVSITGRDPSAVDMTIPEKITYEWYVTGPYGDNNATHLTSLTVGDFDVVDVNRFAFYNNSTLTRLTISAGVTNISEAAFAWCENLKSASIGNNVKRIGSLGFGHCTSLQSVAFGERLESIGDYAFCNSPNLTSIILPDSVKDIEEGAFSGSGLRNALLGSSLTNIGQSAFCETKLLHITIPSSVRTISERAFYECSDLQELSISNGVQIIGKNAFDGCESLRSLTIPDSVTTIADEAFADCSSLSSLTVCCALESVGNDVFMGCDKIMNVTIADGAQHVPDGMFKDLPSLENVRLPDSLKRIGEDAFSGCENLNAIVIPATVTNIGHSAFYACHNLSSITLEGNAPVIEGYAFAWVDSFCTVYVHRGSTGWGVNIPGTWNGLRIEYIEDDEPEGGGAANDDVSDAVELIGASGMHSFSTDGATIEEDEPILEFCDSATASVWFAWTAPTNGAVTFSTAGSSFDTVLGIYRYDGMEVVAENDDAYDADDNTSSCTVNVEDGETYYIVVAGYNESGDAVLSWGFAKDDVAQPIFTIENGILTAIDLNDATDVTIPYTVTSIGEGAFAGCSALKTVTIPSSVREIGYCAFERSGIEEVVLPEGVEIVDGYAFSECPNLTRVVISSTVTKIGADAFRYCSQLSQISVASGNSRFYVNDGVLYDRAHEDYRYEPQTTACKRAIVGLSTLTALQIEDGTEIIDDSAFAKCHNLQIVVIPDSVMEMGCDSFSYMLDYDRTTIPGTCLLDGWVMHYEEDEMPSNGILNLSGVRGIASEAFGHCSDIRRVIIPEGVKAINPFSFYECVNLQEIAIPSTVTTIGQLAFGGCESLTAVTLPESLTQIGDSPFDGTGIASIEVPCNVQRWGQFVFAGCESLTNVTFRCNSPNEEAAPHFFATELPSIVTVRYPTAYAENWLNALWSAMECYDLSLSFEEMNADGSIVKFDLIFNLPYNDNGDGTITLSRNDGAESTAIPMTSGELTIPFKIHGKRVVAIENEMFYNCTDLTSVTIPDSVTNIGDYAFAYCENLTALDLGNGVIRIGMCAFEGCSSLTDIAIPDSLESMGERAFSDCNSLLDGETITDVHIIDGWALEWCGEGTIPEHLDLTGLRGIADSAFYNCTYITSVKIPGSFKNIGECSFYMCGALESVEIGYGVTDIGNWAFFNGNFEEIAIPGSVRRIGEGAFSCGNNLSEITIGNGVKHIGAEAFSENLELTTVVIPSSVIDIGERAFASCENVTNMIFRGDAPIIGESAFDEMSSDCLIYVKRNSSGWDVEIPGTWNGMRIEYLADSPEVTLPLIAADALPEAVTNAIAAAGFVDAEAITAAIEGNASNYNAFVSWANDVSDGVDAVVASPKATLSYLLGTDALVSKDITSNDVHIASFEVANSGESEFSATPMHPISFTFEVAIDGINIGGGTVSDAILKENLKKVLGVEGSTTLTPDAFSSDNIDITFTEPVDGKARFTLAPPSDVGNTYYMRVKVK